MVKKNFFNSKEIHNLFKKHIFTIFLINIISTIFFGIYYWIVDTIGEFISTRNPKLAKKYLNWGDGSRVKSFKYPNLLYWFYISMITQTTIGYGGIIDSKGRGIDFNNLSYPYVIGNFIQMISVFAIPVLVLFL